MSQSKKVVLFEAIKDTLFSEPRLKLNNVAEEVRHRWFSAGLACVHFASKLFKRNGRYRSRQRYLCKDCEDSFTDTTATPLSGKHYPEKWVEFRKRWPVLSFIVGVLDQDDLSSDKTRLSVLKYEEIGISLIHAAS